MALAQNSKQKIRKAQLNSQLTAAKYFPGASKEKMRLKPTIDGSNLDSNHVQGVADKYWALPR